MSEAQTILKMIETVSPDDTATMDEIDARVWCFVNSRDPEGDCWIAGERKNQWQAAYLYHDSKEYTRSRDALKAIRPEGWHSYSVRFFKGYRGHATNGKENPWHKKFDSPNYASHPTEELAELHAIIQAIEYERSQS